MLAVAALAIFLKPHWALSPQWSVGIQDSGPVRLGYGIATFDLDGNRSGAATCTATGIVLVTDSGRIFRRLSRPGPIRTDIVIGGDRKNVVLLPFGTWDDSVEAVDLYGHSLWIYDAGDSGIDDVCSVAMKGGAGFAISYNGGGGLRLLSRSGKPMWLAGGLGNAWSVASARTPSGSRIMTIGDNGIAVFDLAGKRVGTIPDSDAGAVAAGDIDADGYDEAITLGTTVVSGLRIRAWSRTNQKLWGEDGHVGNVACQKPIIVGHFSGRDPQIVVGAWDGVRCYDGKGTVLATLNIPGVSGIAAMSRPVGPDLLLVRRRNTLTAFTIRRG